MDMNLEKEALHSAYADKEAEKTIFEEVDPGVEAPRDSGIKVDFNFLLAKTGEGPVSDYVDHPLNDKKSEGVARILRGMTGIFGTLDYGIVDVALGTIKVVQEKKGVAPREQGI